MDWQPIETAPKDGRTILVFDDGEVVTVKWRYDDRWGGAWGSEDYIQDGSIYDDALIAHSPTHWMPLPDPPQGVET